jgi:oxygen-independent coproporphyrinogen-3 oxidase
MDRAGYMQYEISNTARPGRRSRHNLKYWTDGDWLGLGCGAHSTRDGVRWRNVSSTDEYISALAEGQSTTIDRRVLSMEERLEDALFMALRLNDGIDVAAVKSCYAVDVWERFGDALQPFVDQGVLLYDGRTVRLTRGGMLIAHEIMTVFIR